MDRTTRGLLAGIIAGIAMNVWNLFDYYVFHITKIRFLDWLWVLLTLDKPENSLQSVIALIIQIIIWDGFLGVVFAHLLVMITSQGIVYKSTIYGLLLWFSFKVAVNFYRIPVLSGIQPFPGALSNLLAVILWGIILGLILKIFEKSNKGIGIIT
ncbi:hypothetical protein LPY66_15160 [Dehalobacter sp. DCM]|uniref:hypothetical protein n=1 Tax=Dehalobacter sp. DCM TaxID=2907827 RepID=UPI003081B96C|nr:hypothetical protein LPY66_15160 [Dehalobacter sp. DCM]